MIKEIITSVVERYIEKHITKEMLETVTKEIVGKQLQEKGYGKMSEIIEEAQKKEIERYMGEPKLNKEVRIDKILAQFIKYDLWNFLSPKTMTFGDVRKMEETKIMTLLRKQHKTKK